MTQQLASFITLILFLFSSTLSSQSLPKEWHGKWEGTVDIWSYNNKIDSFPMSLEIQPLDSTWTFIINYNRDIKKPDVRKYQLIVVNPEKNHLAIDEKNSIILDSYFNDDCLYTRFGGMGSDLLTRICLSDQELNYEITSNYSTPLRVSGNEVIGNDTIPEIKSYDLYHIMKAKLRKAK